MSQITNDIVKEKLVAIDIAINQYNNEKNEIIKSDILSNLKELIKKFPNKIEERINDTTIGKFIDVTNKVSIYVFKQANLTYMDVALYTAACLSPSKDMILKKFFALKEKQMIIEELNKAGASINKQKTIPNEEINNFKIFYINRLSSACGQFSKEERLNLLNLFCLRGLITDERKLFSVKVEKESEGYKKNFLSLDLGSLNHYMTLNNNNDIKSISLNAKLFEMFGMGFDEVQIKNKIISECVTDLSIMKYKNIEIIIIGEEKNNRKICELLVNKIKYCLSNLCIEKDSKDLYLFMYECGKDFANEIREMKLKEKLNSDSKKEVENKKKKI